MGKRCSHEVRDEVFCKIRDRRRESAVAEKDGITGIKCREGYGTLSAD